MKRDIRNEILEMMKRSSYGVTVQDVINELGIAPMTAKRHLARLQREDLVYFVLKGNCKIHMLKGG